LALSINALIRLFLKEQLLTPIGGSLIYCFDIKINRFSFDRSKINPKTDL
jgi:hypothetical protein